MKHNLIIPLAADKPEYDRYPPEWLDLHPGGNLMIYECIRGLPLHEFDRICCIVLAKHDKRFGSSAAIKSQFKKVGLYEKAEVICLDEPTRSQPETVARAIEAADIRGSIFIKDGDNFFECSPVLGENCIAMFPLDALKSVNPANKSYIMLDDNQYVTNIIEKVIISRFFCVGGYGFEDVALFSKYFYELAHHERLYTSHIIYAMLLDKHMFRPVSVKNYVDWGTRQEWLNFKRQFVTLFVPLCSLFPGGLPYRPVEPVVNTTVLQELRKLYDGGKTRIVILSEQSESDRQNVERILKSSGVKYHHVLFEVFSNSRILPDDSILPANIY